MSPQNARSELNEPAPGSLFASGISRGEYPSGCMFCVYSNVLVASATGGGVAPATNGSAKTVATASESRASRMSVRIEHLLPLAGRWWEPGLLPPAIGWDASDADSPQERACLARR